MPVPAPRERSGDRSGEDDGRAVVQADVDARAERHDLVRRPVRVDGLPVGQHDPVEDVVPAELPADDLGRPALRGAELEQLRTDQDLDRPGRAGLDGCSPAR